MSETDLMPAIPRFEKTGSAAVRPAVDEQISQTRQEFLVFALRGGDSPSE
jgi:hypothetical protein